MTVSALHCRAIYDQSFEDVAWHVGDNNGMPLHTKHPTSDLAKSIAQSSDKGSLTSRVTSALRQAAHMDSAAEPPQGQDNWQKGSALQTIALDEQDLPTSLPEQQVGLLPTYAEVLLIVLAKVHLAGCTAARIVCFLLELMTRVFKTLKMTTVSSDAWVML